MSMFADIAIESTVHAFVSEIEKNLNRCEKTDAAVAYKKMGRFALTQLETSPEWLKEFEMLFKE